MRSDPHSTYPDIVSCPADVQVAENQTVPEVTTEIYFKISGDTLNEVMIECPQ